MYRVCVIVAVCLTVSVTISTSKRVTSAQEAEMRKELRNRIHTMKDANGFRFLTAGIIRAGFHDCVMGCDGCIDTRRLFASSNNGLAPTWRTIKLLWENRFFRYCSRADFFALAVTEAIDYTAQRAEQEGICERSEDEPNDCRPPMTMLWGRRTCDHAQMVPPRNIPDADADPYSWFKINMDFTPRETVCSMGSHAVGKLRRNETGFEGDYTTKHDVLDNEYYKKMVNPKIQWVQKRHDFDFEGFNETRHQWEAPNGNLTRVNSDFRQLYNITKIGAKGRVKCVLPPTRGTRRFPRCPLSDHAHLVLEMANDNKAFLKCFGETMDKMLHVGYRKGELVPTGEEIPPPPRDPITFTQPVTTTATPPPVQTNEQNNAIRDIVNQSESRAEQRRQRKLRRQERRRNRRNRNSPRLRARDQLTRRGGLISSLLGGNSGADNGADETTET